MRRTTLKDLMKVYHTVQLATLVASPPRGEDWVHEVKFDGFRLLGFLADGEARLVTRNRKDWTDRFPSIVDAMKALRVQSVVMDMEAAVTINGKTSFQELQNALGGRGTASTIVGYVFDILHLNGEDLRPLPLLDRKRRLQSLLHAATKRKVLIYSDHFTGDGEKIFEHTCRLGLEGIISKQAKSLYAPGRQKSWLKTKCTLRQEFIILGFSQSRSGPRAIGALYLGYTKQGTLRYAGKVGTGFTMQSAHELAERFGSM